MNKPPGEIATAEGRKFFFNHEQREHHERVLSGQSVRRWTSPPMRTKWKPHSTWRRRGATLARTMADSISSTVRALDRINLRLAGETFEAIDAARQARQGNISRNTWIAGAVEEKLAQEHALTGSEKATDRYA